MGLAIAHSNLCTTCGANLFIAPLFSFPTRRDGPGQKSDGTGRSPSRTSQLGRFPGANWRPVEPWLQSSVRLVDETSCDWSSFIEK